MNWTEQKMAIKAIPILIKAKSLLVWSIVGLSLLWSAISLTFFIERQLEGQKERAHMVGLNSDLSGLPHFTNGSSILAKFGMLDFLERNGINTAYLNDETEFPLMAAIIIDFIDSVYSYHFWKVKDCQCYYAGPNRFILTRNIIDPLSHRIIMQDSINGLTAEDLTQYINILKTKEEKQ
jgi:hypothetical protein